MHVNTRQNQAHTRRAKASYSSGDSQEAVLRLMRMSTFVFTLLTF